MPLAIGMYLHYIMSVFNADNPVVSTNVTCQCKTSRPAILGGGQIRARLFELNDNIYKVGAKRAKSF